MFVIFLFVFCPEGGALPETPSPGFQAVGSRPWSSLKRPSSPAEGDSRERAKSLPTYGTFLTGNSPSGCEVTGGVPAWAPVEPCKALESFLLWFSTAVICPSETETEPAEGEELPSTADSQSEDESDDVRSV